MKSYIDPQIERNARLKTFRRSIITLLAKRGLKTNTLEEARIDLQGINEEEKLEELLVLSSYKDTSEFFIRLSKLIPAKGMRQENSLWSQEKETAARLDGYRKLIITFLKNKESGLKTETIQKGLDNIKDEEKLINLVQLSVQAEDVEKFLKYI